MPVGTALKVVNGNLNISTPGVYSGLDVHGFVRILAPNVTIKNSILRGGKATGDTAIVTDLTGVGTNFTISDSTIVPEFPSVYLDGLDGWNYTATRVNISGTTDGAKMFGDNATIQDSWIHDLAHWASDPDQHGGPSHNDDVQILGGHNLTIKHNTLQGGSNSAVQVTQTKGSVTDLSISDNWAGGGACTVNLQDAPMASMSGISVDHNQFTNDSTYKCAITSYPGVTYSNVSNSWVNALGPISVIFQH